MRTSSRRVRERVKGKVLKDLWGFDVALGTWREIKAQGSKPPELIMAAAFVFRRQFCIHGGKNEGGPVGGISCYSNDTNQWKRVYNG